MNLLSVSSTSFWSIANDGPGDVTLVWLTAPLTAAIPAPPLIGWRPLAFCNLHTCMHIIKSKHPIQWMKMSSAGYLWLYAEHTYANLHKTHLHKTIQFIVQSITGCWDATYHSKFRSKMCWTPIMVWEQQQQRRRCILWATDCHNRLKGLVTVLYETSHWKRIMGKNKGYNRQILTP